MMTHAVNHSPADPETRRQDARKEFPDYGLAVGASQAMMLSDDLGSRRQLPLTPLPKVFAYEVRARLAHSHVLLACDARFPGRHD